MFASRITSLLALLALGAAGCQAFTQAKLPVALDGVEPVISNKTMNYHYNKHYAAYITNLNAAYSTRTQPTLTNAIKSVGTKGTINATAIQKQGGGAWNHALYFKTLAPPGSAATQESAIAAPLAARIKTAFGDLDTLKANMSTAAMGVFGSGWAWLCVDAKGALLLTTTANQDNPLMGTAVSKAPECTPILGLDVWEHAYYVDHGPARKDYVDSWWSVVNWPQVSANYANAVAGKVEDIVA